MRAPVPTFPAELRVAASGDSARRFQREALPRSPRLHWPSMIVAPAYAQTAAGAAPAAGGAASLIQLGLPFILVFVAFYVLVQRPQARRQKAFAAKIAAVKKNDGVVTAGGIVGKVTRVEDAHVEVEIAANTRVRVVKSTLAEVTSAGTKPAND